MDLEPNFKVLDKDISDNHVKSFIKFRNYTEKKEALKILNSYLCLMWKSDGISFDKALEELKGNCKIVDNI